MLRIQPHHILFLALAYLGVAWSLFFAVDVWNLGGSADRIAERGFSTYPSTWFHIFAEAGPTEMLQWVALGAAGIIAAVIAGLLWNAPTQRERSAAMFWLIMSAALTLMLIEDAGNPRHQLREWAEVFGGHVLYNYAAEFAYFLALAAVPLYALVRYGRAMWSFPRTRPWLLAGFATYGAAAALNAVRHWDELYEKIGERFEQALGGVRPVAEYHAPTSFFLMDYLVEESIEFLGAALLLAATIAFLREVKPTHAEALHRAR